MALYNMLCCVHACLQKKAQHQCLNLYGCENVVSDWQWKPKGI